MNYLNNSIGSGVTGDSGLQLNNVDVLYTRVQRVYIKPQHKEERQRELRVNVEVHAGLSPVCRKVTDSSSVSINLSSVDIKYYAQLYL